MFFFPGFKRKSKREHEWKYCGEEGCNKRFFGHPLRKYCEYHRKPHRRKKDPEAGLFAKPSINLILPDDLHVKAVDMEGSCRICGKSYVFRYLPGQKEYPAFCESHRNLRIIRKYMSEVLFESAV